MKTQNPYYLKNKEKYIERHKLWRKNNPHRTRHNQLVNLYGITLDEYNSILDKQDFSCAICHKIEADGRSFCVDHNHETKKVRGLLCHLCNRALGQFKESIEILSNAIEYLKKENIQ